MKSRMNKDRLYSGGTERFPGNRVSDFVFDENVANVFGDMIARSVPGYGAIISMIGVLAEQYVQPGSQCYDLGCSTGAVSGAILSGMGVGMDERDCRVIAVDTSAPMLEHCRHNLAQLPGYERVETRQADISDIDIENASLVVLNFTLQFVDPDKRHALLTRIYQGMLPGGILILSEKVCFEPDEQAFQTDMHHNFKRLNGYSELEISRKRSALENVLIPESLAVHKQRLHDIGFSKVFVWFQSFNFVSLVAFR